MDRAEREKLEAEIRKMGESLRPNEEELRAIKKLAEKHSQMARQLSVEQRAKMDAARQEIQKQMAEMRETLRRDLDQSLKGLRGDLQESREHRRHPKATPPPTPKVAPAPPPVPPAAAIPPPPPAPPRKG